MKILCMLENIGQGGAERQLIGLATMLAKEENEVKIIIYDADFFYLPLIRGTGVECVYLPKAKNKFRRIPIITNYIKQYKPDIVVAFLRTPSILSCLAKRKLHNFKLIVSERNTTQQITFADRIKFYLYKYADYVVPNSYSQQDFIRMYFPELASKTITITNFTDTDYFYPAVFVSSSDYLHIICVGRVCAQKNVKIFIDAIRKVTDMGLAIKVDWYGLAFHPYFEECLKRLKLMHLENAFHFHQETSDIRTVYQNANVLILPSIYEGFPNVICEAMSCGLPVLCSNVCDNGRIVRDGVNGYLFAPQEVDDIVDSITKFAKLRKVEIESMRRKSREFALADFSMVAFFDKYKKIMYE